MPSTPLAAGRALLPFVILPIGVMVALYGDYATPSETGGLGAVLALLPIAFISIMHAGVHPADGRDPRLLPAAGVDHPDDRADHPAAASRVPAPQGRRATPMPARHAAAHNAAPPRIRYATAVQTR